MGVSEGGGGKGGRGEGGNGQTVGEEGDVEAEEVDEEGGWEGGGGLVVVFGGRGGDESRRTDAETEEAEEGYGVGGEAPAEFAGAGLLLRGVHGGQWVSLGGKMPKAGLWGGEAETSLFLRLEAVGLRRLARLGSPEVFYLGSKSFLSVGRRNGFIDSGFRKTKPSSAFE